MLHLLQRQRDARLNAFEGSKAISSDAYFGGGDDDGGSGRSAYSGGGGGNNGGANYDSVGAVVDTGKKVRSECSLAVAVC